MLETTIPVPRGCGERKQGGIYLESGLSPNGILIKNYLIDPPIPVDDWDIPKVGQKYFERNGVWHLIDWVGEKHYPNVLDFYLEVKNFGLSRRVSSKLDFSKLSDRSQIFLVHRKAFIDNAMDYKVNLNCPKQLHQHETWENLSEQQLKMCCSLYWNDLKEVGTTQEGEKVRRQMPSFNYLAEHTPAHIDPVYRPAMFLRLPITNLAVIRGSEKTAESYEAASASNLEVKLLER